MLICELLANLISANNFSASSIAPIAGLDLSIPFRAGAGEKQRFYVIFSILAKADFAVRAIYYIQIESLSGRFETRKLINRASVNDFFKDLH